MSANHDNSTLICPRCGSELRGGWIRQRPGGAVPVEVNTAELAWSDDEGRSMPFIPILAAGGDGTVRAAHRCPKCFLVAVELRPEDVGERVKDDTSEPITCLSCGETIPPGTSNCPACNWSYDSDDQWPIEFLSRP